MVSQVILRGFSEKKVYIDNMPLTPTNGKSLKQGQTLKYVGVKTYQRQCKSTILDIEGHSNKYILYLRADFILLIDLVKTKLLSNKIQIRDKGYPRDFMKYMTQTTEGQFLINEKICVYLIFLDDISFV